ncbi:MAG: hypothetical protein N5P05_002530 [Chroococcopsis gigantea SAG 12.99]|jgi:hypothetical protein|nr:hypothetical protein [Chroococcopsis gigantea SAG 12.99]
MSIAHKYEGYMIKESPHGAVIDPAAITTYFCIEIGKLTRMVDRSRYNQTRSFPHTQKNSLLFRK